MTTDVLQELVLDNDMEPRTLMFWLIFSLMDFKSNNIEGVTTDQPSTLLAKL